MWSSVFSYLTSRTVPLQIAPTLSCSKEKNSNPETQCLLLHGIQSRVNIFISPFYLFLESYFWLLPVVILLSFIDPIAVPGHSQSLWEEQQPLGEKQIQTFPEDL